MREDFFLFCACELCFYSSGLVPSITILLRINEEKDEDTDSIIINTVKKEMNSEEAVWPNKTKQEKLTALGTLKPKYFFKDEKILQANPLSITNNFGDKLS